VGVLRPEAAAAPERGAVLRSARRRSRHCIWGPAAAAAPQHKPGLTCSG
jgi:hypothetical protein